MPVSEVAEGLGRLSLEELSEYLVKEIYFLGFCRYFLNMDNELIESFKFRADFCDDIKREHILQSFKRDPMAFVQKHFGSSSEKLNYYFGPERTQIRLIPGLRERDIYELIDFYHGKGCWERIAFEKFGVQISQTDKASAQRELSEEQKRTMLYYWSTSQESQQEAQRILNKKYSEFKLPNRVF